MGRLRVLSGAEVCAILAKHGFVEARYHFSVNFYDWNAALTGFFNHMFCGGFVFFDVDCSERQAVFFQPVLCKSAIRTECSRIYFDFRHNFHRDFLRFEEFKELNRDKLKFFANSEKNSHTFPIAGKISEISSTI